MFESRIFKSSFFHSLIKDEKKGIFKKLCLTLIRFRLLEFLVIRILLVAVYMH